MSNTFKSTDDVRVQNTLRHSYRKLTAEEKQAVDAIKDTGADLMDILNSQPGGREMSLAKTKLEEAVMWAVKGITK